MIRVEVATFDTLKYVTENLREPDRIELSATAISEDPGFLAEKILATSLMAFVSRDKVPITTWGLVPMWPGVGYAFAYGTNDWGRALLTMTKHVNRFMFPVLLDLGFHRIECRALAGRTDTGRWLKMFGAVPEACMRSSGKRGEDFILYRWLRDEHRRQATNAPGNPDQAGNGRGRSADHRAGDDAATGKPDLQQTVSM